MKNPKIISLKWHEYINHFFLLIIPLMFLSFELEDLHNFQSIHHVISTNGFAAKLAFISIVFTISKIHRLFYQKINIPFTPEKFKEKIEFITKLKSWDLQFLSEDHAIFHFQDPLTWGGLEMNVLRKDDFLLINSICLPTSRSSVSILCLNTIQILRFKHLIQSFAEQEDVLDDVS